jgi:hypothetical protein
MKKKANKKQADPDMRAEYDFKLSPRAKDASCVRESAGDRTEAIGRVHSWAPLIEFPWIGGEKRMTVDTWIRVRGAYTGHEASDFRSYLSQEERKLCQEAEHWLQIDLPIHSELSSPVAINSFLVALWVVAPTRTQVPCRFEETKGERVVARRLDRFQWIEGQVLDEIHNEHLQETARLLRPVRDLYTNGRRLKNALVLTYQGCVSKQWQVAFTCFAAAAEAILSRSTDHGVSRRLAEDYALLAARDDAGRKEARERFLRLYGVRSVIVHGRAHSRHEGDINLKDLTEFSNLLRGLWRIALEKPDARAAFESGDEQRRLFFKALA